MDRIDGAALLLRHPYADDVTHEYGGGVQYLLLCSRVSRKVFRELLLHWRSTSEVALCRSGATMPGRFLTFSRQSNERRSIVLLGSVVRGLGFQN
jgi:hypothetical protein